MAWRIITIENPAKLSLKDNKLVIKQDAEVALPLEDIDSLIIDHREIIMTANSLAALANFKVSTLICDEKHLPATIILPHAQSSRGAKNARQQLGMGEALRKQLWRKNIIQKIKNQATVLKQNHFNDAVLKLEHLASTVRSGDVSNNESQAARIYFNALLGGATRRQPMWYNSALNYGYAIVRSSLAQAIAARGLITEIGINHHSELNQYNLVDDLIESFRPLVDDYVLTKIASQHIDDGYDASLNKQDRHLLIDIMNQYGIMVDNKYTIKHLTDLVVESFLNAINQDDPELFELPSINI